MIEYEQPAPQGRLMVPHDTLMADIGKAVIGAAALGFPAYLLRLPLILAYILAGVLLGPHIGFSQIKSAESIAILSEMGLVLLMFILGLEIDIRKLLQAGKAVLINGITQFVGCALLAVIYFKVLGLDTAAGDYTLVYLAMACSLSSTLIVVKILSERMELHQLTSRITLGILVIQDLWAISFLAVQPDLANLSVGAVGMSVGKAGILVSVSWGLARFFLPWLFQKSGKQPELMLIIAMAWCLSIAGLADLLSLSPEMGALIAGVAIASFPYHVDIAAKVSSVRDFFITLFFVSLGLQIPSPTWEVVGFAAAILGFVLFSRMLTVFPVLHFLNYGNRASLLPALNLSQLSEFSLVLGALGVSFGHINGNLLSAFVIAMITSALLSSVVIPNGHAIYRRLNKVLIKIGFADHVNERSAEGAENFHPQVILLGFYREASSLLRELVGRYSASWFNRLLVVDFNPEAHQKLSGMGIHCKYGDIGNEDTLRHLDLSQAKLLVCTIPDQVLKGTSNLKLLQILKNLAPQAKVIVTAETMDSAREMYRLGADYVFIPRLVNAHYLADVMERVQREPTGVMATGALQHLDSWNEVLK